MDNQYQPIAGDCVTNSSPVIDNTPLFSTPVSPVRTAGLFIFLVFLIGCSAYFAPTSGTRHLVEHPIMMPTTPFYHSRFVEKGAITETRATAAARTAAATAAAFKPAAPVDATHVIFVNTVRNDEAVVKVADAPIPAARAQ